MTSADGKRRSPAMSQLFSKLAGQNETPRGTKFVFRGDRDELWAAVTTFVDEESLCCPFYTYEQRETDDGVTLAVNVAPAPVNLGL
jgi:hypothetical protein